ncbi:MAG: histidine phosphatase family protein [Chitinophagaceae bacterium]|nr:histidine phosphatase family protein [Chitinophagaceae bacterium]MCW5905307.1 histidine phosphatase family protein [Chitinophagaceae bacterium]
MKKIIAFIITVIFLYTAQAQTTYILIRHAEKDTTANDATTMYANPPLSKQGMERAENLVTALKNYSIDDIYATNFIRTQQTVTPLAKKYRKEIISYDYKKLSAFADELLLQNNKTIVIAGHNTTTPALVNLLIKQQKFTALPESVYNKIFIVSIAANKEATVQVVEY